MAVLALILALLTFGKVLSPRRFIWILPAWALVAARDKWVAILGGLTLLLTGVEPPYWRMLDTPRRADPDDCEGAPDSDTPIVQELQATVSAAEQAAEPYTQAITILEGQMGGLRAAPRPDRAMLELLGTGRTQYAMHPDEAAGGRPP